MKLLNFPLSDGLNPRLYQRICENLVVEPRHKTKLFGRRTSFKLHEQNIKEVSILTTWIDNILPQVTEEFARSPREDRKEKFYPGYNPHGFKIVDCWGATYNKGESLDHHNHFPYTLSFVYGVKIPQGSSCIVVENKRVNLKEGDCLFFLATQYHHVNSNRCDGRCVMAGNILYTI